MYSHLISAQLICQEYCPLLFMLITLLIHYSVCVKINCAFAYLTNLVYQVFSHQLVVCQL